MLRQVFSLVSRGSSDTPTTTKTSSLVSANYTPVFQRPENAQPIHPSRREWAVDAISAGDNALRTEINDMYTIFLSLEHRPFMLSTDDIGLFYEWYGTFHVILQQIFYLEEEALFPWIEGTDGMSREDRKWRKAPGAIVGEISDAKRRRIKGDILRRGNVILDLHDAFKGRPILHTLPLLADAARMLVDEILTYLHLKMAHLPRIINERLRIGDKQRFEKSYWSVARQLEEPACVIVASTDWMRWGRLRRWKFSCLNGGARLTYAKWRAVFYKSHRGLVDEFLQRVRDSEKEREIQVRMNDMARARALEAFGASDSDSDSDSDSGEKCEEAA